MQSTDTPTAYGQAPGTDRPGSVTAAAIILMILGVLLCLGGILFLIGGAALGSGGFGGLGGALGGAVAVIGVVLLAFGVLEIVTGINLFGGKSWARIVGFILAGIGLLFSLFGLLGSFSTQPASDFAGTAATGPNVTNIIINLVVLVAYAYVIYALATAGRYFNR